MPADAPSTAQALASSAPQRRDYLDATVRLATSWVGLFAAYAVAVVLLLNNYTQVTEGLKAAGLPLWGGIALLCAFPLAALVFSTLPTWLDQRRITRYAELTGPLEKGYFSLRPREQDDETGFDRADQAHQDILRWLEKRVDPVLYLTGASGTGKSSLLVAWVLPKLKRSNHVVVQLRGYEQDLFARLRNKLLEPGGVWEKPPSPSDNVHALLVRAAQRLGTRRLFIVIDQFEEFLILRDANEQEAFRRFLAGSAIDGVTFLLVYRPEYERLIQDDGWPPFLLETRKVVPPFTENSAHDFLRRSGQTIAPTLLRAVLREAADLDQTPGLIRPITLNMCGLVLGRFSGGLPRRFRGGLIRGFLRESMMLPEVRDVAEHLLPALITDNVTKHPRRIHELAAEIRLPVTVVRVALRRLGESDRGIVRALDAQEETWEISHDFLVPLLDAIVARGLRPLWRRIRPWLPWTSVAAIAVTAGLTVLGQDPIGLLLEQGWQIEDAGGVLTVSRSNPIDERDTHILLQVTTPIKVVLRGKAVLDLPALKRLTNLTQLDLHTPYSRTDLSALKEFTNLSRLTLDGVTDLSALKGLTNLTQLKLSDSYLTDVSALKGLTNLTQLDLSLTRVTDVSALKALTNLTQLDLSTNLVRDVSALKRLTNLTELDLRVTGVTDVSALKELTNLKRLDLGYTGVTDVSALGGLKNLTRLDLTSTRVTDVSALGGLRNLTHLRLWDTRVKDVSPLKGLANLEIEK